MDRVFSVDDISDHFWPTPTLPPPPPIPAPDPAKEDLRMSRSASEWALQMFLQETATSPLSDTTSSSKSVAVSDLVVTKDEVRRKNLQNKQVVNRKTSGGPPPSNIIPFDSEDYQDFLKSRLDMACAAVALKKAPYVIGQGSAGAADSTSQGSADSLSVTQAPGKALQNKDVGGPMGNPSLFPGAKKVVAQIKSNVSGSSRELSDDDNDDEAEGENETTGNRDPTAAKRVRRMLSNRESARRSRRRKQAHLSDLETQVSQLKVENSSLAKRLTDISHKFNEAAVDNRVLKADIETLRAKVKMAEETVKRVTNISPLLQAMSEIPTIRAQTFSGSPSDSADSAVPVHNPKQQLYRPPLLSLNPTPRAETVATAEIASTENALPNPPASKAGANKIGRTASMQRVASLEHLQKRICGGINQSSSDP